MMVSTLSSSEYFKSIKISLSMSIIDVFTSSARSTLETLIIAVPETSSC